MTGPEFGGGGGGGEGRRDAGRRGDSFHGPAGVQRGSGNLQVNFHEHRTGILSACAVALVCVATVIAVRVGGDPGTGPTAPPSKKAAAPAPGTAPPGTAGADPPVLTGRLVNDDSGLCLRVAGTGDGLVPVQDTCTATADRTWTLDGQDGGATRTLRNGHSGLCVTVAGPENHAPARQLACTGGPEGRHWELLWGTGDRTGHFALRSIGNAKCLVVQGPEAGRPAVQMPCGQEYDDQWWHLAP
ncbi:ricin-type beta-trefoil lectin domain protein [Streptomyces sp. NPDC007369]|uniref:RICIN domain-containing protein n=1 Tax=Streptomyces sp. NPDC007369 TaxID=3154589 RepID=UPI0033D7C0D4